MSTKNHNSAEARAEYERQQELLLLAMNTLEVCAAALEREEMCDMALASVLPLQKAARHLGDHLMGYLPRLAERAGIRGVAGISRDDQEAA